MEPGTSGSAKGWPCHRPVAWADQSTGRGVTDSEVYRKMTPIHRVRTCVVAALLLTLPSATAALGAEDGSDGSLCDAVSLEELNELTGLDYEPALSESWVCNFIRPSGEGFDTILLALDTTGIDTVEGQRYPSSVDVAVAGASGVVNTDESGVYLVLDVGEAGTLRVNVDSGSAEAAAMDGLALAEAVAGIVVPRLGDTAPASSGPPASSAPSSASDASALAPPEEIAAELGLRESLSLSGEAIFEERTEQEVAVFTTLLETLGAGRDQLSVYAAGGGTGDFLAVRVADAPEGAVSPALLDAVGLSGALEGWTTEGAVVGGKDVTVMTSEESPDRAVHVYANGDTVYLVQMEEDDATALLEALP
jgi:hypothetical protein